VIHDKASQDTLVVPTAAVLYDDDNSPFVYLRMGEGKFSQRGVKVGVQQGDDTQILEGLKEGDIVVSQGSVFLQFANTGQR
jgi:cobalt-zinc-cadmium efflux system membrane fusion protein